MNTAVRSNDKQLAEVGLKRANNDRAWDFLRDVSDSMRRYLSAPAILLPMLGNDELKAKLEEQGKTGEVIRLCRQLGADTLEYAERFKVIHAKHASRRGSSYDSDETLTTIMIGQEYVQFMSSYESVVMPNLQEALELFEAAGLDTGSVRAVANGELVYQLFSERDKESPAA